MHRSLIASFAMALLATPPLPPVPPQPGREVQTPPGSGAGRPALSIDSVTPPSTIGSAQVTVTVKARRRPPLIASFTLTPR